MTQPNEEKKSSASYGGWTKYEGNPLIGEKIGTCFDVTVLKVNGIYRMWLSWRPRKSIALTESEDGIRWTQPKIVLEPRPSTGWEDDMNRPSVIRTDDGYEMWFTGQTEDRSRIGHARSEDGIVWTDRTEAPVLSSEEPWENVAVMCPHVAYDPSQRLYRMWYSGGEQNEPNAIGYAESRDGLQWKKDPRNPIFAPDASLEWERHKVTACQVIPRTSDHLMFYIGFRDEESAQVGVARSVDGVTNWTRHPANPIIRPDAGAWDSDACYKPFAVYEGTRWMLWYNGRSGLEERIGLAFHEGESLGFEG